MRAFSFWAEFLVFLSGCSSSLCSLLMDDQGNVYEPTPESIEARIATRINPNDGTLVNATFRVPDSHEWSRYTLVIAKNGDQWIGIPLAKTATSQPTTRQ